MGKRDTADNGSYAMAAPRFLLRSQFIPFELPVELLSELHRPFENHQTPSISTRASPRPSRPPSRNPLTPCPQRTSVPTKGVTLQLLPLPRWESMYVCMYILRTCNGRKCPCLTCRRCEAGQVIFGATLPSDPLCSGRTPLYCTVEYSGVLAAPPG